MNRDQPFDSEGIEPCCTVTPGREMLDYNGHLNIAFYGVLFEDAARAIFARLDISRAYRERTDCALFAAEEHTVFHREVLEGEAVSIYWRVLGFDGRKLRGMFFMVKDADGSLSAAQEILYLHVDLKARRVGPVQEPLAGRLSDMARRHGMLPAPADAGRRVGQRGGA